MRFRHGDVEIEHLEFAEAEDSPGDKTDEDALPPSERFVILAIRRADQVAPMSSDTVPRSGDVASIAVYVPERDDALRELTERGWWPRQAA